PDGARLIYATYLGGNNSDAPNAVAVDSQGGAYLTGLTASSDFPTTDGAFGRSNAPGNVTIFVAKLDAAGQLAYSTYFDLDSSDREYASGIAVDHAGNAYVAGNAQADAFVGKLNAAGSSLEYL